MKKYNTVKTKIKTTHRTQRLQHPYHGTEIRDCLQEIHIQF